MYIEILILLTVLSIFHISVTQRNSINSLNKIGLSWSIIILIFNSLFILLYSKQYNFQMFNSYMWLMHSSLLS